MSKVPALFLVATICPACGSGGGSTDLPPGTTYDFTATLEHAVSDVIEPTYRDLRDRATELRLAAESLVASPTDPNLEAAKAAWIAARIPWEQSEGYLWGPVSNLGLDPSIDSWPVDRVQLDQVLDSNLQLTAESITANFGGGLRGFHTIEYLLWGADHNRTAASIAARPREAKYLVAASGALEQDANTLYSAWAEAGGYGESFARAGKPGGIFSRQTDAVQQLINGMVDICNEVANGKIADPYKAQDRTLEESQFSYNSIQDFTDDLRSVKFVYEGSRNGVAPDSLSTFVRLQDAALDERARLEIDAAIAAIYAISSDGEPFTFAITNPAKRGVIEGAMEAIRKVMATLQGDVLPLVIG
jgi:putative iron-regulated protein